MKKHLILLSLCCSLWGFNISAQQVPDLPQLFFEDALKQAKAGDAEAQYQLGQIYYIGTEAPQDYKKAAKWTKKAVKQKHEKAILFLGGMYNKGRGVKQNARKAVLYYRQAAELGNPVGMGALGASYEDGEGVPQSKIFAHMWYSLAGDKGYEIMASMSRFLSDELTLEELATAQELARRCEKQKYLKCEVI